MGIAMGKKIQQNLTIRSSAAEYLTFVAASGNGGVEAAYVDENIWLTQKMMGMLYDVETNTINYHLKNVFSDSELEQDSVIRDFRITAADGKEYNTKHYNLSAIIEEFTNKGFGKQYFEERLNALKYQSIAKKLTNRRSGDDE